MNNLAVLPTAKRFRVRTVNDVLSSADASSEYLIKGLLSPGEQSVLYGEPGSGKTFLASHMGYMVSMGWPVFGRKTKPTAVLYICLEGERGFERRICAAAKRWANSAGFYAITERADLFGGIGDTEAIIDAAGGQLVPCGLIIIDTLARAMGSGVENESGDMGWMIANVDVIRRETGAHVMLVHHSGKDDSRGMRGHSSLNGAADTVIKVKRHEHGARSALVEKSKDGIDGDEFGFTLEVVELGKDQDGDPITSCVVIEQGAAPKRATSEKLSPAESGWLKQINAVFAEPGAAETGIPREGMREVQFLTREALREGLKRRGRFDLNPHGNLTDNDRRKFSDVLKSLQNKGRIGMTDKVVWLSDNRVRSA